MAQRSRASPLARFAPGATNQSGTSDEVRRGAPPCALVDSGVPARDIAAVDVDPREVAVATDDGATGICGDATRVAVLEEVEVSRAARVVIGTNRDDTAVLATLTVRQLNPTATIVAVVRHAENAPLLRTAGSILSSSPQRQPDGCWASRHCRRQPVSSSATSSKPARG